MWSLEFVCIQILEGEGNALGYNIFSRMFGYNKDKGIILSANMSIYVSIYTICW